MNEQFTILLVEDNEGHATLTQMNLDEAGINNPVVWVNNGEAALDYVLGRGDYEHVEKPDYLLILLDLNLPIMDGVSVLETLKANPKTRSIPIIILTTTDNPDEMQRCYDLGCNVYVTKPIDYNAFASAIQKLGLLISVVVVPAHRR